MSVSGENQGRREFGAQIASGAGVLGLASPAFAAAGEGAKFSVFGLLGNGDSYSEGGAYGIDQSKPLYSPYSQYSPTGGDSLSESKAADYAKAQAKILAESEKRFKSDVIPKAIDKKAWSEVTTILTRYLYSMRKSMKSAGDQALATQFFQDIEALNLACVRKNQAVAAAAYEKSLADFNAYKASI
jgi:photosystem II oxygen-evolving enhancer protein 3